MKPHQLKEGMKRFLYFILLAAILGTFFSFNLSAEEPYFTFLSWQKALIKGLITFVILSLWSYYLYLRKDEYISDRRLRDFLILTTLLIVIAIKGSGIISLYLVPVAFGTALLALFLDFEVGLALGAMFSLFVGLQAGLDAQFGPVLVSFLGGMAGILGVRDVRRGSDLTKVGLSVGLLNIAVIAIIQLPSWPHSVAAVNWGDYGWAGLNGLISALFIAGVVPIAERLTQITSPIGLMELLNPSHPLLERMREEAPGSYHHSKNIASLGENAARAIGADPLLTAVGGYYHDIGKMLRPEFFIENQEPEENPHDELTPTMSKIVITSHIKQGIDLGRRYGLKDDVLEFIPTHHGTSVIKYFYIKALREQKDKANLVEGDFRYEGNLPQTKEASIIALADPVEAASRTLESTRGKAVEEMVEEEINTKIEEGQLDESPLTLSDIEKIKNEFVDTLRAMSHSRVDNFPGREETEEMTEQNN